MDLSAPADRAGTHERTREKISEGRRFESPRVETGRARTAAGAGERLAVHLARRHESRLRAPPRERPSAPVHRVARTAHHHERGRKMAGRNRVPRQFVSRCGLDLLEVKRSGFAAYLILPHHAW